MGYWADSSAILKSLSGFQSSKIWIPKVILVQRYDLFGIVVVWCEEVLMLHGAHQH